MVESDVCLILSKKFAKEENFYRTREKGIFGIGESPIGSLQMNYFEETS